jgi:hypothetical protein
MRIRARKFWPAMAAFATMVCLGAPAAWAVGWENVGSPDQPINSWPGGTVQTGSPVYSSDIRLYINTPPGPGYYSVVYEGLIYPDGVSAFYYDYFNPGESSPDYLGVSGGNKYARCSHGSTLIPGNPNSTCQRYSTT